MDASIKERGFLEKWAKTNDDIYDELNSRINTTVLQVMKNYLRENNVEFDGSSIDLNEFKKNVVEKLPKPQQLAVAKLENDINNELKSLTEALHKGSQSAFSAISEKLGGFGKAALKMTAQATAIKTAYALNPTIGGAALAGSIAIPAVVKGVKDFKTRQKESREATLDAILIKLTASLDNEKNEIQYNVPENIMTIVKDNLKNEGISIDTSDELSFIRDVAGLEADQKESVIKVINNLKGNPIDFDSEVKDLKTKINNVKKVLKDDIVSPLSTAAMVGLNIGNSLATWNPEVSASIVTALGTGLITGDMTIAAGVGATQYGIGKAAQFLPDAIGDIVQNANEIETMAGATGMALGGALLLKVVPTLAYHGAVATKNYIKTKIDQSNSRKMLSDVEKESLGRKIDDSLKLTAECIEGKNARQVALGIIADTLRSKGIEIDSGITTKEELKKYAQGLSREDKSDVIEVANVIEEAEKLNENQLKVVLSNLAKTAYWGGVIALAGLGAYDAFINPGFIEGLVARDALGLSKEATLKENIEAVKENAEKIPSKIKDAKGRVVEAIKDPKGYLEKKRLLRENQKQMIEDELARQEEENLGKTSNNKLYGPPKMDKDTLLHEHNGHHGGGGRHRGPSTEVSSENTVSATQTKTNTVSPDFVGPIQPKDTVANQAHTGHHGGGGRHRGPSTEVSSESTVSAAETKTNTVSPDFVGPIQPQNTVANQAHTGHHGGGGRQRGPSTVESSGDTVRATQTKTNTVSPDFVGPVKPGASNTADRILSQRIESANKKYEQAVEQVRKSLPDKDAKLIKDISEYTTNSLEADINMRNMMPNDKVIEAIGIDSEEGLLQFFQNFDANNPNIANLLKESNCKTIEELAKCKELQYWGVEKLGGRSYFDANDSISLLKKLGFHKEYKECMVNLINERADSIIGDIPGANASNKEITEFAKSFIMADGSINNEKMKYYNLLVESNKGISKNELNKFALESIIENNLPDGVQQSVVDYRKLNDIDNLNKASEAVSKNINEIQKAEETVKAVLETQEGFKDGLSSKLTSNPTKIAGAGAAVGLGAGAVNEINQKSKNKIAEVWRKIRSLFRKKQKALPEVQNDNDEQQYKDSLKYETGPNMGVNGSSSSNSQRANEDKERV